MCLSFCHSVSLFIKKKLALARAFERKKVEMTFPRRTKQESISKIIGITIVAKLASLGFASYRSEKSRPDKNILGDDFMMERLGK